MVIGEDAPVGNAEVVAVDRRSRAAEARGGGAAGRAVGVAG